MRHSPRGILWLAHAPTAGSQSGDNTNLGDYMSTSISARTCAGLLCLLLALSCAFLATSGQPAAAVSATTGTVIGRVTGPNGTAPPTTLMVAIYDTATNQPYPGVRVDAYGRFRVDGLAPGKYRFRIVDERNGVEQYAARWVGRAWTFARARSISVKSNTVTDTGTTPMRRGGSISGTVTAAHGAPLSAPTYVIGVDLQGSFIGVAQVRPDGTYAVGGFPTGRHTLQFSDNRMAIADQYWRGALTLTDAKVIHTYLGHTRYVRSLELLP